MSKDLMIVPRGAGGGKSGGGGATRTPTEAKDTLRSKQIARVIDLLCEGEIEGPVNGLQSVFFDGVPVENADGSYNFKDVLVAFRAGTQGQEEIQGFDFVESVVNVGTEVTQSTPVTKQVSDTDVDTVRVTVGIPILSSTNTSNGDVTGTAVRIQIQIDNNGGGYVTFIDDTISGKSSSRYQRSYLISLPDGGPWTIRMNRVTADSGSQFLQNATFFDSYTEIKNIKLTYPNSALTAVAVNAEQFRQIPQRAYHMKGLKISVPDNYDPETRTYTGVWGGTFSTEYSNNPAWVYYDLITNDRYGVGKFITASQIDKYALYTIAQYCDELVDDGFGGLEPRFTCNIYISDRDEAINVISNLANVFRGIVYWSNNTLMANMDKPTDAIMAFNETNVIDGVFTYSGSAKRSRHTVALVSWNNPDNFYQQEVEYVPDNSGIASYGINETEVVALGCTSRGQAHRLGKYILISERTETETVTFNTSLEGTVLYPGCIFEVQDQSRAGARWGGRIVSATAGQVNIDQAVTISASETYILSCVLPNGSYEEKTLTNPPGPTTALTPDESFSAAPQAGAIWVISSTALVTTKWRALSIAEGEDYAFEVVGVAYNENKFAEIENGIIFDEISTSIIREYPGAPNNLALSEEQYLINPSLVANKVFITWDAPSTGATSYKVTYFVDNNNPITRTVYQNSMEIENALAGNYTITITAFNAINQPSPEAVLEASVIGSSANPTEPQNPTISKMGGLAVIRWDKSTELDVLVGGFVEIRHTGDTVTPQWITATPIGEALAGYETVAILPLLPGTYLLKYVDNGGRYSDDPALVETDGATILQYTNLTTLAEHTAFSGVKTDMVVVDAGILKMEGQDNIDDWGNIDDVANWDSEGGVATTAQYEFATNYDGGSIQRVRLRKYITSQIYNAIDFIDSRTDNMDDWADFDGITGNEISVKMYVRATDDDPTGSPTWTAWEVLDSAEYENRAFEFKIIVEAYSPVHNVQITELGVYIDELV